MELEYIISMYVILMMKAQWEEIRTNGKTKSVSPGETKIYLF